MGIVIRLLVITGLAIDAYVHIHLAPTFRFNDNGVINGEWLFRLEGAVAAIAAILVAVRPSRPTYLVAFVVAAGGVAAVLLFSMVNLGKVGPLPTIYEPIWYTEKTVSLIGEAVAAVAALGGILGLDSRAGRHVAPAPESAAHGASVAGRERTGS